MEELPVEYRKHKNRGQVTQHFCCHGPEAVVDFWVTNEGTIYESTGIECHYREPPSYMYNDTPSRVDCTFTGGKCWHDGSSLYAVEHLLPLWKVTQDVDQMLIYMRGEYIKRFYKEAE